MWKKASALGARDLPSHSRSDPRADGCSPARAGIPPGPGREGAVVAIGDVVEGAVNGRDLGVKERGQRPNALAEQLVDAGGEASPKRSNGAPASDGGSLAINVDVVAGNGVRISPSLGDSHSNKIAGV